MLLEKSCYVLLCFQPSPQFPDRFHRRRLFATWHRCPLSSASRMKVGRTFPEGLCHPRRSMSPYRGLKSDHSLLE